MTPLGLLQRWRPRVGAGRPGGARPREGFTLVELLTVTVVIGTLMRVTVPGLHEVTLQSRAAEVVADVEAVQLAVLSYRAEASEWPADAYTGQIPDGLERYLPQGFTFDRAGYRLDWENWALPRGLPRSPDVRNLLGISVVTEDRALGQAVLDMMGQGRPHHALDDSYTFVIQGM